MSQVFGKKVLTI